MQKAYNRAHMINGDLSEYNILYDGNRVWIIDWPQFAPTDHPNAAELLIRDIANVITFFEKRFDLTVDIGNALKFVRGERKSLSIRQG
jgi:RIO kinase 2